MNEITFEAITEDRPLAAPQGPTTNALVQNPFAWEDEDVTREDEG